MRAAAEMSRRPAPGPGTPAPSPAPMATLRTDNLSKTYGGRTVVHIPPATDRGPNTRSPR